MANAEINPFRLAEQSETAPNHAILTGFEFLQDIRLEAEKARNRVWGQAMSMQADHPGQLFFHVFEEAARKGLDSRLNIDHYSELVSNPGINAMIPVKSVLGKGEYHKFFKDHNHETLRRLSYGGVFITFLNPPTKIEKIFPFTGRSHIKMYMVDDTVYLGGINIGDNSFKGIDFVVKYQNSEVAEALAYQFEHGEEVEEDYQRDFANGDQLIVDAGDKGKSSILDRALEMVGNATDSVRAISFFTPDGRYAKALSEASKRGIDVEVIRPEADWGINPFSAIDMKNRMQIKMRKMYIPFIDTPQSIHAKLLIVDDSVAIFGSHNFMESGVRAGTEEIAMRTQNSEIVQGLLNFYSKVRNREYTKS